MCRNYFAHYTFIYPDIFLKNHVVCVDAEGRIAGYHAFEKETPNTLFHSGLQVFIPENKTTLVGLPELLAAEPRLAPYIDDAQVLSYRV
ncbi:MAG: hypothetical protein LBR34_03320 [Prevotella sp.]|jgi:hypothetical protein|nr:hypothetical protein [Prevotella sp.]